MRHNAWVKRTFMSQVVEQNYIISQKMTTSLNILTTRRYASRYAIRYVELKKDIN